MNGSTHRADIHSPRRMPRPLAIVVGLLLTLGLAGCAQVPQAVLGVPGSHTFSTLPGSPSPGGTVAVCYSGQSELYITTSVLAFGSLDWTPFGGTTRRVWTLDPSSGENPPTAVLEPGCGTLRISAYFEHGPYTGPPTITVYVTNVAPA